MLAWYEAIKKLTEVSGAERNAYVQSTTHNHNNSPTIPPRPESVSDGLENDEADDVPYSGQGSVYTADDNEDGTLSKRPEGGRFPSDFHVTSGHRYTLSEDSSTSAVADATAFPGVSHPFGANHNDPTFREADLRNSPTDVNPPYVMPHAVRGSHNSPPSWIKDEAVRSPGPSLSAC